MQFNFLLQPFVINKYCYKYCNKIDSQAMQLIISSSKTLNFKAVCKMVANKSNTKLEMKIFQIDMNYYQFMRSE